MATRSRMLSYEDYHVGVVCALTFEMSAVRYMLDVEHERLPAKEGDANIYILGELSGHNVALTCLPGNQGKSAAAAVATSMSRSFPHIKYRLLVGIGGGVPSKAHDIRLGDVVVSMPDGQYGGIVQYDLGSDLENRFRVKGFLHPPPTILRSAVQIMRSDHLTRPNEVRKHLSDFFEKHSGLNIYKRPASESDILFESNYPHDSAQASCDHCDRGRIVIRRPRDQKYPRLHYGLIASGDRVMKSAAKRAALINEVGNILCFEMEAAGLLAEVPCIVIRGISDYADSHKNDEWQYYAAAAAAACTKELLSYLDVEVVPTSYIENNVFSNLNYQTSFHGIGLGSIGLRGSFGSPRSTFGIPSSSGSSRHEVYRADLERMAGQISDPFVRSGFEMAMRIALESPGRLPRLREHMSQNVRPTRMDRPSVSDFANDATVNREGYDFAHTIPPGSSRLRIRSLNGKRNVGRLSSETEGILGKISTYTRSYTSDKEAAAGTIDNTETSYTIYPPEWILRLGVTLGVRLVVSQMLSGWKWSLEPLRVVPNDSLVMAFCRLGNLEAIRTLIERGEASPNDTITIGWSLLHIASLYAHSDIIEFLLDAGANPMAMTCEWAFTSVPPALAPVASRISPLDDNSDDHPLDLQLIRRTPREEFDFEGYGLGIYLIDGILDRYDEFPDPSMLAWALREFFEDMRLICPTVEIVTAIACGLECNTHLPDMELLFRILDERGIEEARDWDCDDCWDYWFLTRVMNEEDEGDLYVGGNVDGDGGDEDESDDDWDGSYVSHDTPDGQDEADEAPEEEKEGEKVPTQ